MKKNGDGEEEKSANSSPWPCHSHPVPANLAAPDKTSPSVPHTTLKAPTLPNTKKNVLSLLRRLELEALDNAELEGVVDVLHNVPVESSGVLGVDGTGLDQFVLEVVDMFGLGEEEAD